MSFELALGAVTLTSLGLAGVVYWTRDMSERKVVSLAIIIAGLFLVPHTIGFGKQVKEVIEEFKPVECGWKCEMDKVVDLSIITELPWRQYIIYGGIIVCLMIILKLLQVIVTFFAGSLVKKSLYKIRGITYYEALQPGSDPQKVTVMPPFQMQVMYDGFFSRHVGFAIRIDEDWAVVPTHVWKYVEGNMLLGANGRKIKINPLATFSRLVNDVTYIKVGMKAFSELQVTKPRLVRAKNAMVNLVGHNGKELLRTMGQMCPSKGMKFMVRYTGSSVAGFSGAAYYSGKQVYAMHSGTTGSENLGISMGIISDEFEKMRQCCVLESNWEEQDMNVYEPFEKEFDKEDWRDDYAQDLAEAYEEKQDTGTNIYYSDEPQPTRGYDYSPRKPKWDFSDFDWDAEIDYELFDALKRVSSMRESNKKKLTQILGTPVKGQSPGASEHRETNEIVDTVVEVIDRNNQRVAEALALCLTHEQFAKKMEDFEKYVLQKVEKQLVEFKGKISTEWVQSGVTAEIPPKPLEEQEQEVVEEVKVVGKRTLKCTQCNRMFKDDIAREIHKRTLHAVIEGEALNFVDSRREVKTQAAPFLGPRYPNSQNMRKQNYTRNSRMQGNRDRFIPPKLRAQLNAVMDQWYGKRSTVWPKNMDGQQRDHEQKSDHS